ncbi:MAG: protein-L-isoaspartate O-methyltransferase [Devosia sp. 67-54]|uniref:protein-L-isoaspartate O-methyltransferase family protein n=1 Tax=unclassified Devosia TaxID=196773 RepID=UPI000968D7FD|nr:MULTISPECIES: protein-L-isoaspartate O-methyltransferase [unclassified Devosia]MBN9305988.1 protein-L-isoaspartate O-methyltransferase [Devosia sp.]OJX16332.1 MAG: protein-L-isoaspartate O-methyltransferase [Devosia sp. 67-54]
MRRRTAIGVLAASLAGAALPHAALASVPTPYDWTASPPFDDRQAFIDWMVKNRGEDPGYLGERYDRFLQLIAHHDVWDTRNKRAFLMVPRERFVTAPNLTRAYQVHYLDIGFGVTITGPHSVARMTNSIDVQKGERVLEIGTGSGYQSAYLSNLTDQVYSIEIIKPLFERTGGVYADLIAEGYTEYKAIQRQNADGYYGWADAAPFDKIIVTCGIDHVPPDLLKQLKPNGLMVIPIGPPGAQHVLKITKRTDTAGAVTVTRSDIYGGAIVNFVPFTKLEGDKIVGTHSG